MLRDKAPNTKSWNHMHTELDSNKKNYRKLIFCNKYLIPMSTQPSEEACTGCSIKGMWQPTYQCNVPQWKIYKIWRLKHNWKLHYQDIAQTPTFGSWQWQHSSNLQLTSANLDVSFIVADYISQVTWTMATKKTSPRLSLQIITCVYKGCSSIHLQP